MMSVPSVRPDLVVRLPKKTHDEVVEFWRWLLPPDVRPLFATALGDLFVAGDDGRVMWLDVGRGELTTVAASWEQFTHSLAEPEARAMWFGEALVDRLRESGRRAKSSQCYSYLQLPVLGGDYVPENYVVRKVVDHFRGWGPILERLSSLPDGSRVQFVIIDPPPEPE